MSSDGVPASGVLAAMGKFVLPLQTENEIISQQVHVFKLCIPEMCFKLKQILNFRQRSKNWRTKIIIDTSLVDCLFKIFTTAKLSE